MTDDPILTKFLDLWSRWSDSFRGGSLQAHADIDEQFRNYAYDYADALARGLHDALAGNGSGDVRP